MWPYWLMYLVPVMQAILVPLRTRGSTSILWVVVGLSFALLIGFREQVGGDWPNYLRHYDSVIGLSLHETITAGDPGYRALNWLMAELDRGIYWVNFICGAIFISGLMVFCYAQSRPWLAFAVAVPYVIVVVAMGYTRQSVALGLIFWALTYLERGKFIHYVVFVAVGALFHKTAIIMIPLGMFLQNKGWLFRIIAVGLIGVGLWSALIGEERQDHLWDIYVEQQMRSEGAKIRVLMNLVPALFLLSNWKQWKKIFPNALLWLWMSLAAIACVVAVNYASTAVDRIALYLLPLQVVVFSRLPLLMRKKIKPSSMVLGLVLGYAAVLYVWLNYAGHAFAWLPYRNVLFQ